MNRLRRFYEKVPYGRTSSRVAYVTNRAGLAAVGLCAFVGIYFLGEYFFSDREPESVSETGD
jgi:hypothetical protein